MSFAACAVDFGSGKDQLVISSGFDHFGVDRLPKTWPAGAAVEFVLRRIGREVTACAIVDPGFLIIVHVVGKGALGVFVPQDLVGLRHEQFSPLLVGLHDFDNLRNLNLWRHRAAPFLAGLSQNEPERTMYPYTWIGRGARQRSEP